MALLLLTMLFLGIVALEVPGLVRRKMWGELAAFAAYLLMGMALTIPQALGVRLPNPTKAIEVVFEPLIRLLK